MSEDSGGKQLTRKQMLAKIGLGAIGGTAAAIGGTAAIMKGAELVGAAVQGVVNARDNRASGPSDYAQVKADEAFIKRYSPPLKTQAEMDQEKAKARATAEKIINSKEPLPDPTSTPSSTDSSKSAK